VKKAFAYIDGFNLYYRAVKGTPYKWLNLRQMCELLVPEYDITRIKYFTAPVSGKDDPEKPARQQTYLRALRTISVEVVMGKFLTREVPMRLVGDKNQIVMVLKTEEKGSDVNLAAHLLIDGFTKQYEAAIVLSNDSDLTMPIQYVRDNLGLEIVVINPDRNVTSKSLANACSAIRQLRKGVLETCQFPDTIYYPKGVIKKPSNW
jgi:uncharacterized LabA/DUF88 family protein